MIRSYNIICMCFFVRVGHLVLDTQLVCSFPGEFTSPNPNTSQLSAVLCVRLRYHCIIPICLGLTSISDVKVIGGECTATNLLNQHNP